MRIAAGSRLVVYGSLAPGEANHHIVEGLNAEMGAGTYDYLATGAIGTDAIRVALIYKPATVSPVGDAAILDSSVDARFDDARNRPVLAQAVAVETQAQAPGFADIVERVSPAVVSVQVKASVAPAAERFDLVLRNGRVIDPESSLDAILFKKLGVFLRILKYLLIRLISMVFSEL